VFSRVAERHPQHRFATFNTEQEPELVESLGISHIPTLMLYRDGLLLFQQPGYLDEEALDDVITQAESLDMAMVRAEIEAEKPQTSHADSRAEVS
jgi:thioredoxin 1